MQTPLETKLNSTYPNKLFLQMFTNLILEYFCPKILSLNIYGMNEQ